MSRNDELFDGTIRKMRHLSGSGEALYPHHSLKESLVPDEFQKTLKEQWSAPTNQHNKVLIRYFNESTDREYFIVGWDGDSKFAAYNAQRGVHNVSLQEVSRGGMNNVIRDGKWNTETILRNLRKAIKPDKVGGYQYETALTEGFSTYKANLNDLAEGRTKIKRSEHNALMRKAMKAQGTSIMPAFDRDEYPKKPGLEGPFHFKDGRVLYYDAAEGSYYDSKQDLYVTVEDTEGPTDAADEFHVQEAVYTTDRFVVCHEQRDGRTNWAAYKNPREIPLGMTPVETVYAVDEDAAIEQAQLLVTEGHIGSGAPVRATMNANTDGLKRFAEALDSVPGMDEIFGNKSPHRLNEGKQGLAEGYTEAWAKSLSKREYQDFANLYVKVTQDKSRFKEMKALGSQGRHDLVYKLYMKGDRAPYKKEDIDSDSDLPSTFEEALSAFEESTLQEAKSANVQTFLTILGGLLTAHDRRSMRSKYYNPNALGMYLGGVQKAEKSLKNYLAMDDAKSLNMMLEVLKRSFIYNGSKWELAPLRKLDKQVNDWLAKGKFPKYPTGRKAALEGLEESYSYKVYWDDQDPNNEGWHVEVEKDGKYHIDSQKISFGLDVDKYGPRDKSKLLRDVKAMYESVEEAASGERYIAYVEDAKGKILEVRYAKSLRGANTIQRRLFDKYDNAQTSGTIEPGHVHYDYYAKAMESLDESVSSDIADLGTYISDRSFKGWRGKLSEVNSWELGRRRIYRPGVYPSFSE